MKLILCLDGGGCRGQFDLAIIAEIEKATGKKIWELVDLVAGVSVGAGTAALIATKTPKSLAEAAGDPARMFDKPNVSGPIFKTKYDGTGKTRTLQRMFGTRRLSDTDMLPLVILAATIDGDPAFFTSWEAPNNSMLVSAAVDASMAAPVFFPPVKIAGQYYIDGAMISNDPVVAAIYKAHQLWGEDEELAILSMGTGSSRKVRVDPDINPLKFGLTTWLVQGLLGTLSQTSRSLYPYLMPRLLGKGNYMRIDCTVNGRLDDFSYSSRQCLLNDAAQVWDTYRQDILGWLQIKQSTRTSPVTDRS